LRSTWIVLSALGLALVVLGAKMAMPASSWAIPPTGALSQLPSSNCVSEEEAGGTPGCVTLVPAGLSSTYEAQVSPDNKNVYSVAINGALVEYSRNQANGALTVIGCVTSAATVCAHENETKEVAVMTNPAAIAISPDGKDVYVVTQGSNNLVEFRREEDGLLAEIGCISHESTSTCAKTEAKGLHLPYGLVVSPDGKNVYVASYADEAIAEFARNTATGELQQLEPPNDCISSTSASGCTTTNAIGLEHAIGVVVSPGEGDDVYVAAGGEEGEGAIVAFRREPATGALTQLENTEACISTSNAKCLHGEAINGPEDLTISPDGKNVYANSYQDNAVIELARNGSTGGLEQLAAPNGCLASEHTAETTNCTLATGIKRPLGVAVSGDDTNVYASGSLDDAEAAFSRDLTTGALTQLESPFACVTSRASGCGAEASNLTGLGEARRVTVSPDGTNVYLAGQSSHAIAELSRAIRPTVTGLSSSGGVEAGGNEITIEGSGFVEGATVEFAGAGSASEVHVQSASAITAVVPPGHSAAYVVVTTPAGTSAVGAGSEYVYGRLGGLNIAGYCEGLGYQGNGSGASTLLREGHVEGPEYAYENWACVNSNGAAVPIAVHGSAPSMDNACAVAFPSVPSHAHADNPENAFSWNCYEGAPPEETKGGGEGPTTLPPLKRIASELIAFPLPIVVPPPVLGKTGNVAPVKGTVLVELPGTKSFVPLASLTQIPFGTVIEATNGTVSVTTANPNGTTQTGQFFDGQFILTQGKNGQVLAKLSGGNFAVCPTARERAHIARAGSPDARAAASGKHVVRKLWANAHGKFSTEGNYAAGAVQGTEWLTEDLCEGTLIRVTRDKVAVTNLVNHKHVEVRTGHKYLAKAP
jgi:DNA-binding beta-propeller fold protein YncE